MPKLTKTEAEKILELKNNDAFAEEIANKSKKLNDKEFKSLVKKAINYRFLKKLSKFFWIFFFVWMTFKQNLIIGLIILAFLIISFLINFFRKNAIVDILQNL